MINIVVTTPTSRGKQSLIQTAAFDTVIVSTIFCGDVSMHNYETLVFESSILTGEIDNFREMDCMPYSNKDEADKGHDTMIEKWQKETRALSVIRDIYENSYENR
jgi:hypothetical protein